MSRGPKSGAQRAKASKHLRGGARKKRFKENSEAQKAYHSKIAQRRAKRKLKGKGKKNKARFVG
jgi:hypothetical protein